MYISVRVYECVYSHVMYYIYSQVFMSLYSHTHIGLRIEADGKHSLAVRRLEVISKFY